MMLLADFYLWLSGRLHRLGWRVALASYRLRVRLKPINDPLSADGEGDCGVLPRDFKLSNHVKGDTL